MPSSNAVRPPDSSPGAQPSSGAAPEGPGSRVNAMNKPSPGEQYSRTKRQLADKDWLNDQD